MSRKACWTVLAFLSLVVAGPHTQSPGQPSTRNGDWPHYTADMKGNRYSPLDQINASNFNQLEVAWRFKTDNLGPRPEYKLEGTPVAIKGVLYTTASSPAAACRTGPTARATTASST
jgi:quinoprotein glucose dehydrogenase